jgi:hypothetical protein
MTYDDDSRYRLTTGTVFYAHRGILGLAPDGTALFNGYDGEVTEGSERPPYDEDDRRFTAAERAEIADSMIARWTKWKSAERRTP